MKRLINFTNSIINHASNNFYQVNLPTFEQRMSICKSCEKFNSTNTTCNECGCFLNIKASWASEKCPLDKWGPEGEVQTVQPQPPPVQGDCGCNKKNV